MIEAIKQILILARKSDKKWLIPLFLFLIIATLVIIYIQISPLPVFLYPII